MKHDAPEQFPFFVYGTLIPGQPNDHLWLDEIVSAQPAVFTNGRLYDMGYYPMLIEEGGAMVRGKLITVSTACYEAILNGLDALEGFVPEQPDDSSFIRVCREVTISTGQKIQSWLYVGRQEYVSKSEIIAGGDWVAHALRLRNDIGQWWTSVNTVWGLHSHNGDA